MMSLKNELRRLRAIIGRLNEQMEVWSNWHCQNNNCNHHMCKVRQTKMYELKMKINIAEERCYFIELESRNRYA